MRKLTCGFRIGLGLAAGFLLVGQAAFSQSNDLIWSSDGQRFCFQNSDSVISIGDVKTRALETAFDTKKVAQQLREEFQLSGTLRPVAFDDDDRLVVAIGDSYFRINEESGLDEVDAPEGASQAILFSTSRILSRDGRQDANLKITNATQTEFSLSWIDSRGAATEYHTLRPGESISQHTFVRHAWRLRSLEEGGRSYYFSVDQPNAQVVITEEALAAARPRGASGRRRGRTGTEIRQTANDRWEPFVRDHNLWLRARDSSGEEIQLTDDASYENTFQRLGRGTRWFDVGEEQRNRGDLMWSPDGETLIAFQTKRIEEPRVHYIESSPRDQLQPKLQSYQYPKPGDDLLINRPRLFSMKHQREIPVSNESFSNPFDLRCQWDEGGERFLIFYNERGHQRFSILSVNVADGLVSPIIEETCDTFLHYSDRAKCHFEMLNDEHFLWSSERSGWNHLYRHDRQSGEQVNAITSGKWNVKRIHKIDRTTQTIWFYAVGIVDGQDPYHEHFCRVGFDGQGFQLLTDGDGTHEVELIRDDEYLLDTWSRVDLPPVRELRHAETGEKIVELHREGVDEARRRKLTTRFVAKGRDGQTDIWGIIHWPIDFNPEQQYPVVENIYAGPHDHHVPKRFRARYGHQYSIADAGMIVVQIDGMGTAWRSKAFHDVCFQNLRDAGFPDRIAWIKAAAAEFPQMDLSRVGIYGGSAGGQNAMAALLWHNDFYKVAVADCGCHDNRMDKIWWNEQWMGWPVGKHYEQNSNMENAHLLQGKLMLVLGELDRNVDPASTTQVVRKLIEADKDFEFVLVAGAGHGAAESRWGSRKRLNFLKQNLASESRVPVK